MKTFLLLLCMGQPKDTTIHFWWRELYHPTLKTDTEFVKDNSNPYYHKGDTIVWHHWGVWLGLDTNNVKRDIRRLDSIRAAEKFKQDQSIK